MDDTAAINSPNLLDLRQCDGLAVRDHGQGLQSRLRKAHWRLQALDELAQDLVVLGLGGELIPARDGSNLNTMILLLVIPDQLFQLKLHPLALFTLQNLGHRIERNGLRCDVDDGLDHSL